MGDVGKDLIFLQECGLPISICGVLTNRFRHSEALDLRSKMRLEPMNIKQLFHQAQGLQLTMTTVGYGNIVPKLTVVKLLTISWMLH